MYIKHPKSRRNIFLDNSISIYEDRLKLVEERILMDEVIMDYCRHNSIIKNSRQEHSYYMAENLLDKCATFLLKGQFKKNGIMTLFQIRNSKIKEVPASTSNTNAEDLIYAMNHDDGMSRMIIATPKLEYSSDIIDDINLSNREIEAKKKRNNKKIKKYKQSKSYRIEKMYSTPEIETYRVLPVYTKDIDGKKIPMKNAYRQQVFEDVRLTIGGNKGIIDKTKPYTSKWCVVDTDNEFVFMDKRYQIDGNVEQYSVGEDNKCQMDKILCYYIPYEDKLLFFDQDIYQINNSDILQVH